MIDRNHFEEFRKALPDAKIYLEGGSEYIYIPVLQLPAGCQPPVVEALLCPHQRDGYATRLFLSSVIPSPAQNWTEHHILGKVWHTWSWQNVAADQKLIEILLGHLDIFR